MAFITLNTKKLQENYLALDKLFKENNIEWGVVSKLLCGNKLFLSELLKLPLQQISDSRISNLKIIKKLRPDIETVYIKPPPKRSIKSVVQYADVSFNTEYHTIALLSQAAIEANKIHKIVIMIELGELREGVLRKDFLDFYKQVFQLKNIQVVGIGTNLTCMNGVLPNQDKLIQLSLYKQLVEAKFDQEIPYISGGTSVTLPLLENEILPQAINHFRIGETLFLGNDVYHNRQSPNLHNDIFKLYAEIIELNEKPIVPQGELGVNMHGEKIEIDTELLGQSSNRAIIDIGLLDIEQDHICPIQTQLEVVGASSDMLVIDLGENKSNYKVGDLIEFKMDYMGILRIMNSYYVEKKLE